MKKLIVMVCLLSLTGLACKVKSSTKDNTQTVQNNTTMTEAYNIENKTLGKVSHQYRATGCSSVIEIKLEGDEIQTLIPKDKLAKEFDVDGTEIYFNFLLLRMPQPEGCSTGQPAEITDIVKKK